MMFGALAGGIDGVKSKLILYIVVGIIAIVIMSVLLDGIKRYIRGLDTAALGALFLWLGIEANKTPVIKAASPYLIAAGGTLVAAGLLVFIIIKLIRGKRRSRQKFEAKHQALKAEQKAEQKTEQKDPEQ